MIVYIDRSTVRDGKLAELEIAMKELVEFVEGNEEQLLAFNVYFSADGGRMTVVHVHSDAKSLETHMRVVAPRLPRFAEFIDLDTIDVYGEPIDDTRQQLQAKASTLGRGDKVTVHELYEGFDRSS